MSRSRPLLTTPASECTVPPLTPPWEGPTTMRMLLGVRPRFLSSLYMKCAPRSDGSESKPQQCRMRAPEACAVGSCALIMS